MKRLRGWTLADLAASRLGPGSLRPRVVLAAAIAGALGLLLAGVLAYTALELARFQRIDVRRATPVYAAPQELRRGVDVRLVDLTGTLSRLKYRETRVPTTAPGQFRRGADSWEIFLHAVGGRSRGGDQRVRFEVESDRITGISVDGVAVESVTLEPEAVASVGAPGASQPTVRLADVPGALRDAVLAAEDARFFEHGSLDAHAVARALWVNVWSGKIVQGGSTITQQLVKNRLLGPERTLLRKVAEAWLAMALEWRYSKEQIFEAYLNDVYLGHWDGSALRGVGAGARAYFGKEVYQLTAGEAAVLAGMIRAPNTDSPAVSVARARERRDLVLSRMRDTRRISEVDYQRARREPVRAPRPSSIGSFARYFLDYVRQDVARRLDRASSADPAPAVWTTLDVPLQRFAEAAVARGLDRLESRLPRLRQADAADRLQAALIALDPTTGQIRALVGGRDYRTSQFNRAVLARRQPGSAFKPFVYVTALAARGGRPALTPVSFVEDEPLTVSAAAGPWSPRNYKDRYEGRVTVRRALEDSLNAATVRIAQTVGFPAIVETARAFGLEGDIQPVPALALGAFDVTPLELARAYLPLANGGVRRAVTAVREVSDGAGRTLWAPGEDQRRILSPAEAYLMTSLLQGVINSGTGAAARALGVTQAVAGKTGTTNHGRDAWFVGYSSNLLALVWVGFDGNRAHGLSGAEAALPIWADFMKSALAASPAYPFPVPPGVTVVDVDLTNGKRANRYCALVAPETFLVGTEPEVCDEHGGLQYQIIRWWRRLWD